MNQTIKMDGKDFFIEISQDKKGNKFIALTECCTQGIKDHDCSHCIEEEECHCNCELETYDFKEGEE